MYLASFLNMKFRSGRCILWSSVKEKHYVGRWSTEVGVHIYSMTTVLFTGGPKICLDIIIVCKTVVTVTVWLDRPSTFLLLFLCDTND